MVSDALFCTLENADIAHLIRSAMRGVCYAAPGVQINVAKAMAEVSARLGPEMVTACVDFDERVFRMGYGDLDAVTLLCNAGIKIRTVNGLRTALVIADHSGFIFTPTALYLEAAPIGDAAPNAIRMSHEQTAEALARLSPAAKVIAVAQAQSLEEKHRINALPVDVGSQPIDDEKLVRVTGNLKQAPPVRFDLARQVRVFEPYLQYVELSLTGAAIQRHRLAIPPNIQKLGASQELERRLRTTFELIEKDSKLSSKPMEDALNEIRKNFTPSLGNGHGRAVLKAAKLHLVERLKQFRLKLEDHQETIAKELQQHLDRSRKEVVDYYLPREPSGTVPEEERSPKRNGIFGDSPRRRKTCGSGA